MSLLALDSAQPPRRCGGKRRGGRRLGRGRRRRGRGRPDDRWGRRARRRRGRRVRRGSRVADAATWATAAGTFWCLPAHGGTASHIAATQPCQSSAACCGGNCSNGTCQPLSTSCKTAGNPCTAAADCCSRLCTGGTCALGASYCIQPGDVCYHSTDCCSGFCSIASGATAGTCQTPNGCQPRGGLGGIKNGTNQCGNAREDCCDCQEPKWQCCRADSLGIPRCFGGSTSLCPKGYDSTNPQCCLAGGQQCKFS